MFKKSWVIFAYILSSSTFLSSFAYASQYYAQLEVGSSDQNNDASTKQGAIRSDQAKTVKKLSETDYLRINIGHQITNTFRAYSYFQMDDSPELNYKHFSTVSQQVNGQPTELKAREKIQLQKKDYQLGAGADYLYPVTEKWTLSTGAQVGMYLSEVTFSNDVKIRNIKGMKENIGQNSTNSGLTTGVSAGIGYDVNDQWKLETGARYSVFDNNRHSLSYFPNKTHYTFKNATQYQVSASYQF